MTRSATAAMAAILLATPAVAAKKVPPIVVGTQSVADKPTFTPDPRKAYILLRSTAGPSPFYFMKVPTAEEQAAYDRLWEEEFAKAHAKYVKKQAAYERERAEAAKQPRGTVQVPDKPVEPTRATFQIEPIGIMGQVQFGPQYRFAKANGTSTYLQAVTPGWYRLYGTLTISDQGAVGACFCMGSVKFEAKAGEVVDLGTIKPTDHLPPTPQSDSSYPGYNPSGPWFTPTPVGETVDPRLQAVKVTPAAFRPVGKLPNYYGVLISRLPPIPGVMRYDRDRIVDLTAQR